MFRSGSKIKCFVGEILKRVAQHAKRSNTLAKTRRIYSRAQRSYFHPSTPSTTEARSASCCRRGKKNRRKKSKQRKKGARGAVQFIGKFGSIWSQIFASTCPLQQFTFVVWPGATIYRRLACFPSAPCVEEYTRELKY